MRIESVDFFYAAMPTVTLEADGSQDALLVRVRTEHAEGWGECEASPLTSIAAFVTPRSHGVCQPISASVIGQRLDSPADIARIEMAVRRNSMDLLQAAHTFSGIEIAMWDLLGHALQAPVWALLGHQRSLPKTPYASLLFGATPQETLQRGREVVRRGFRAVKFGWGSFGTGSVQEDQEHLTAAREGIGDAMLLVDAGQVWEGDVERAVSRIEALERAGTTWIEEPFFADAYDEHAQLAARTTTLRLAGGEGAHSPQMALNLIRHGNIGFVQIDTGRIGGIGPANRVATAAVAAGVQYVNHTFTSHLALTASLQPFAGLAGHDLCEYPAQPKSLAAAVTTSLLAPGPDGTISAPELPGLGLQVDLPALQPYLRQVRIEVDGMPLYADPLSSGRLTTGAGARS